MPTFEITSPDGRKFRVTGPEGSTREQALARIKAQQTQPVTSPQTPEPKSEEMSQPDELTDEFAKSKVGAAAYGLTTGLPGGKAVAALLRSAFNDKTYEQNRQDIEREATAAFEDEPLISGAGTLASGAAAGGALVKGASALPVVGSRIAAAAKPTLEAGKTVANAGQLAKAGATGGALLGGASGVVEGAAPGVAEGDPAAAVGGALRRGAGEAVGGAIAGGVLAPVTGAAVQAVAPVVKRVAAKVAAPIVGRANAPSSAATKPTTHMDKSIELLSRRLKVSPDELRTAVLDYRDKTGGMPSLAEVLDIGSRRSLADVAQSRNAAGDVFNAAAEQAEAALPSRVSAAVRRGGAAPTQEQVTRAAAASNEAAMAPVRQRLVDLPEDVRPRLQKLIADQVSEGDQPAAMAALEQGRATVDTLDSVYQTLGRMQKREPGAGYGELRSRLKSLVTTQVPEYAKVRQTFERTAQAKAGYQAGRANRTAEQAASMNDARSLTTPASVAAQRGGTRRRLIDEASASERGALSTAQQLAEPTSARAATPTLDAAERTRLSAAADKLVKGREAVRSLAPKTQRSDEAESAQDMGEMVKSALIAGSNSTTLFKANMATRMLTRLNVSASTAKKLAEAITDPAKTDQTIDLLRKARVNETEIRDMVAASARAAGVLGGEAAQAVGQ